MSHLDIRFSVDVPRPAEVALRREFAGVGDLYQQVKYALEHPRSKAARALVAAMDRVVDGTPIGRLVGGQWGDS